MSVMNRIRGMIRQRQDAVAARDRKKLAKLKAHGSIVKERARVRSEIQKEKAAIRKARTAGVRARTEGIRRFSKMVGRGAKKASDIGNMGVGSSNKNKGLGGGAVRDVYGGAKRDIFETRNVYDTPTKKLKKQREGKTVIIKVR